MFQSHYSLCEEGFSKDWRELALRYMMEELASGAEIQNEVLVVLGLEDMEESDDKRMIYPLQDILLRAYLGFGVGHLPRALHCVEQTCGLLSD